MGFYYIVFDLMWLIWLCISVVISTRKLKTNVYIRKEKNNDRSKYNNTQLIKLLEIFAYCRLWNCMNAHVAHPHHHIAPVEFNINFWACCVDFICYYAMQFSYLQVPRVQFPTTALIYVILNYSLLWVYIRPVVDCGARLSVFLQLYPIAQKLLF